MVEKLESRPIAAEEKGVGRRDFLKASLLTTAIMAGIGCANSGPADTVPPRTPRVGVDSMVLQGGRYSGGQIEIGVTRISGDPARIRAVANLSPDTKATYYWFVYQEMGNGQQMLLNPRYSEEGQPRYTGQVMRGVTLSDGTAGDFVVRVRRSGLAASAGPEWVPVVEESGRVRAEDALYQVRAGTLEPVSDARLERSMNHETGSQQVCFERASPVITVAEYGPTTPVLIASPQ
ncbi:MAG: hypothetical protein AB1529_01960 [Candidatus Micrarchaeota archaeon]